MLLYCTCIYRTYYTFPLWLLNLIALTLHTFFSSHYVRVGQPGFTTLTRKAAKPLHHNVVELLLHSSFVPLAVHPMQNKQGSD